MKLHRTTRAFAQLNNADVHCSRHGKSGFAVLGVFVLLTLMVVLVMSNTVVLNQLHREIRLIEQRQLEKFRSAPAQPAGQPNTGQTDAAASTLVDQSE
ncbi:MAG: hypothetical protein NZ739_03295 [Verrucomicrobiae bacterium]|nr:hypothetical protein [Verrucomicrobiae bacterium]